MKLRSALMVGIVLAIATPAKAVCYQCNRSDWNELSYANKLGFVMGAIAEKTQLVLGDEAANQFKRDLTSCAIDLDLNSDDLVDVVDNQYRNLDRWELAPHVVLGMGLRSVCINHINRARKLRGDEPLAP